MTYPVWRILRAMTATVFCIDVILIVFIYKTFDLWFDFDPAFVVQLYINWWISLYFNSFFDWLIHSFVNKLLNRPNFLSFPGHHNIIRLEM